MTTDPGTTSAVGTPIYEVLVHEQGDVLADSRAAAEAARQETSAAMHGLASHTPPAEFGPPPLTDGGSPPLTDSGPGGPAHSA